MPDNIISEEEFLALAPVGEEEEEKEENVISEEEFLALGKSTDPASGTDSGSDDGSSVLLDRIEAEDFGEEPVEEETLSTHSLIKDIPSRQDNRLAAINEQAILKNQDEENREELFEERWILS